MTTALFLFAWTPQTSPRWLVQGYLSPCTSQRKEGWCGGIALRLPLLPLHHSQQTEMSCVPQVQTQERFGMKTIHLVLRLYNFEGYTFGTKEYLPQPPCRDKRFFHINAGAAISSLSPRVPKSENLRLVAARQPLWGWMMQSLLNSLWNGSKAHKMSARQERWCDDAHMLHHSIQWKQGELSFAWDSCRSSATSLHLCTTEGWNWQGPLESL